MIELLMAVIHGVISVTTPGMNTPLPAEVSTYLAMALEYCVLGIQILGHFVDLSYLFSLFTFILDLEVTIFGWRVLRSIFRKVPILGSK